MRWQIIITVLVVGFWPLGLREAQSDQFLLLPDIIPVPQVEMVEPVAKPIAMTTSSTELLVVVATTTNNIVMTVPFMSQAPLGHWEDERQQDGCEEAGALMAMAWVRGDLDLLPAAAETALLDLADWQQRKYGENLDVNIQDVADRIFLDYFQYDQVYVITVTTKQDLLDVLLSGSIILAPTNGQALNNPHFTSPGPERHLLVITGYDEVRDEFITNDPGTRHGHNFNYPADRLLRAIRVYPTGYHLPIELGPKQVLVVEK